MPSQAMPAGRLVLGDESRPALHAPTGTVYQADLDLPANAQLHLGYGHYPDVWRKQRPGLVFQVEAIPANGGESRVLLRRHLDAKDWIGARRWQDEQIDLGALAGQRVTLRFSTLMPESETAAPDRDFGAWSPPALVVADSRQLQTRRNVIVWLVDALRADRLSAYGAPRRTSPYLDRLVREGVVFTRPRAQASWTAASTGSIFTALYPSQHGAERERQRLLDQCHTMAERLDEAGVYTMGLVANGHVKPLMNFDQGFQRYAFISGRGQPPHADASQVLEQLRPMLEAAADRPFFLYVHSIDPHGPYTPPAPFDTLFTDPGYGGTIDGCYEPTDFRGRTPGQVSDDDLDQLRGLYDGEIAWSDLHLGMLIAELRRLGLLESTMVLVTGDHGEEFLDHGGWDHGKTLYAEQLEVPLAGRLPGNSDRALPAGSVIDEPALLVDILPTVLDFFGLLPETGQAQGVEGRSLFSGADTPRLVFSEENKTADLLFSVEEGNFKLIRRLLPEPGDELYDLATNPGETINIAHRHPELVARLAGAGEQIRSRRTARRDMADLDQDTREELRALGYLQ